MNKTNVGFLGLGNMGYGMAGRLVDAGYALGVYDIDSAVLDRFLEQYGGAKRQASGRAAAEGADIVVTVLPSGPNVRDAVFADGGLAEGLAAESVLIDMSSSEPWLSVGLAADLAARDIEFVDAPVSGGRIGAEAGTLSIMIGGADAAVARCMPLFEVMGANVFHAGPVGAGHAAKTLNNMVSGVAFAATAEALAIGKRFGLDPAVLVDIMEVSTGRNSSLDHFRREVFTRRFAAGATLDIKVKDCDIAMRLAHETGTPAPLGALSREMWGAALAHLGSGHCITGIARWIEHLTKAEITPGRGVRN